MHHCLAQMEGLKNTSSVWCNLSFSLRPMHALSFSCTSQHLCQQPVRNAEPTSTPVRWPVVHSTLISPEGTAWKAFEEISAMYRNCELQCLVHCGEVQSRFPLCGVTRGNISKPLEMQTQEKVTTGLVSDGRARSHHPHVCGK